MLYRVYVPGQLYCVSSILGFLCYSGTILSYSVYIITENLYIYIFMFIQHSSNHIRSYI